MTTKIAGKVLSFVVFRAGMKQLNILNRFKYSKAMRLYICHCIVATI